MLHDRNEIGSYLTSLGLIGRGAEIGVYKGEFAETLLSTWPGTLLLVDVWRHMEGYLDSWNLNDASAEENYQETRRRLKRFGARAEIMRLESADAAQAVPDDSLDFIYVDANHSYEAVSRDLTLWYPKVRAGGLISGHDYYDALADCKFEPDLSTMGEVLPPEKLTSYGVKSAVDSFATKLQYNVECTFEEPYPSWYFRK